MFKILKTLHNNKGSSARCPDGDPDRWRGGEAIRDSRCIYITDSTPVTLDSPEFRGRDRHAALAKKWQGRDLPSAFEVLERLKKDANTRGNLPLAHFDSDAGECRCESCVAAGERSANSEPSVNKVNVPKVDDDDDYFAKLAQNVTTNS